MITKTNRNSSDYVGTFQVGDKEDEQTIQEIREMIREDNRNSFRNSRVVLRGRRPVKKAFNPRTGRYFSYDLAGNIVGGLKNASEIDVYIY